jgi:hypothetical protein
MIRHSIRNLAGRYDCFAEILVYMGVHSSKRKLLAILPLSRTDNIARQQPGYGTCRKLHRFLTAHSARQPAAQEKGAQTPVGDRQSQP